MPQMSPRLRKADSRGTHLKGDTQSFIVRIWHESKDSKGNVVVWRGFVERVGNAKRLYFHDLNRAMGFIQEEVGLDTSRSYGEESHYGSNRIKKALLTFLRCLIIHKD